MQTYTDHLAAVKVINTNQSINQQSNQTKLFFNKIIFLFSNILQITIFQRLVIDTCLSDTYFFRYSSFLSTLIL